MFLVPLVVFLGVIFVFENPVCVKEMANIRYDYLGSSENNLIHHLDQVCQYFLSGETNG